MTQILEYDEKKIERIRKIEESLDLNVKEFFDNVVFYASDKLRKYCHKTDDDYDYNHERVAFFECTTLDVNVSLKVRKPVFTDFNSLLSNYEEYKHRIDVVQKILEFLKKQKERQYEDLSIKIDWWIEINFDNIDAEFFKKLYSKIIKLRGKEVVSGELYI